MKYLWYHVLIRAQKDHDKFKMQMFCSICMYELNIFDIQVQYYTVIAMQQILPFYSGI